MKSLSQYVSKELSSTAYSHFNLKMLEPFTWLSLFSALFHFFKITMASGFEYSTLNVCLTRYCSLYNS